MNDKYIVYGSIATVFAVVIYVALNFILIDNSKDVDVFQPIISGSTDTGDVSIELTPKRISNKAVEVDIAANTHSVDLSQFDLKQITTMEYGGKSVKPTSAPRLEGHHVSGKFVFNTDKNINRFKIIIEGIPQINNRVFEWR